MSALSIILDIVLILISIVLIVAVLMQQGQREGLGAIAGGADTFFGKGKAKGVDARLKKITKLAAAVFIVLSIVTTIVVSHGNKTATTDTTDLIQQQIEAAEATEAPAEEATDAPAEDTAEATEVPVEEATEAPVEAE